MPHAPLEGMDGAVGGIESITLDGHRYWFGFDFSSDLVASPLIDDPAEMARYASRHLRQTDGEHDEAYWAELVENATETSDLAEPADTRLTTADLTARRPTYHLRYLLGAATGWSTDVLEEPEVAAAIQRLGMDAEADEWDAIDTCLTRDPHPDVTFVLDRYYTFLNERLPASWRTVFAPLFETA